MSTRLELKGMDAFRAALRSLPDDLAREAGVIVQAQAEEMARSASDSYPEGPTGNLRAGVSMRLEHANRGGVLARVRSRAHHAHFFELEKPGPVRETKNKAGRGRMPATPVSQQFIPKAIRARRRMTQALVDVVRRAGSFEVNAS